METVADKAALRAALKERGLKNKHVAALTGISEQSVAAWGGRTPVPSWLSSWLALWDLAESEGRQRLLAEASAARRSSD